ncbi:hypothetical protein WK57_30460 [Burkholderia ubonensis]|uniref:Uncharacterized protein n=1 Tax=Burkholderia ubonensis TaxID=101571 RepID=A0AA40R541_9BURK|nr:hypothetical protein [Burkholderia ubonensis]KVD71815.1 hypothetical protein WI89_00920 [Burkholderia ubonensis]KVZ57534.1 hypothetical protein WL19_03460 [Burkholderia ubonensis]KWZ53313.1 hypothetical protein WK57_30460 [Burkholderia ubonensis]
MRLHVRYGPARKKPRVGDRRTTKKHGEQIRVFRMARDMRGNIIGYDCTGGRQLYDWVPISEARTHGAAHHWTAEERAKYEPREGA